MSADVSYYQTARPPEAGDLSRIPEDPVRKHPERTAKTRQALINAFWTLYEENPIEKITIRQITESAGVHRGTFYQYFSDVYDARDEIERQVMRSYESFISKFPGITSITNGMELLADFYSLNARYLAVLLGPHGDTEFLDGIKSIINRKLQQFLKIPENDKELDIIIEIGASTVISMLNYWYTHRGEMSIEDVLATSSRFLQHGLLPFFEARGLKLSD